MHKHFEWNKSRSPLLCQPAFDFESRALEASPPPFSSTILPSNDRHPMEKINPAPRMSEPVHSDSHLTFHPGKFVPLDVAPFFMFSTTSVFLFRITLTPVNPKSTNFRQPYPLWFAIMMNPARLARLNFSKCIPSSEISTASNFNDQNVWKFLLSSCQQLSSTCQHNSFHNIVQYTQKLRLSWRIFICFKPHKSIFKHRQSYLARSLSMPWDTGTKKSNRLKCLESGIRINFKPRMFVGMINCLDFKVQ